MVRGRKFHRSRIVCGALFVSAATAIIAAPGPALAASRFAVGADVGTSGVGAELAYQISPRFVARLDGDYFRYEGDVKGEVLTYKGDLKLQTAGLFLDFHPFDNPWVISGGAYIGTRSAEGQPTLQPSGNRIGGDVFTGDELGVLKGKLKLDDFAPFVGVGWNNTFYGERWGFKAMAGAVFGDQPRVRLTRTGGVPLPDAVAARLQAAVRVEEARLADRADVLKVYPLVQVGLTYRF